SFLRFLQRNQRESLETRTLLEIGIMEPVIPGACHVDSELAGDDFTESKAAGGVQHRSFNSYIVHEFQPAVHSNLPEGAGDQLEKTCGMKVIQRRKDSSAKSAALDVRLGHVL